MKVLDFPVNCLLLHRCMVNTGSDSHRMFLPVATSDVIACEF